MSQEPQLSIADKQAFFDGMPVPMLEIRQKMRKRYGIPKKDGIKYNSYVNMMVSQQRGDTDLIKRLRAANTIPDDRYKAHEASSNIMSCFERGSEAVASIYPESDPKIIRDYDRTFWLEGMNDSKTRNYFFEAARRYNFMPELYFLFNTHDSYVSEDTTAHLIAWCKKEGLDLDQIVDNYELPEMDNLDAVIQTGYEARRNAAVHHVDFDPSSDLLIQRRDDGSIQLNYPGLEPEIVDGSSSPESLLARAVMRKAQATGGIIGADVITANTIEDKQRFFSEVDLDVLFRSFVAARDLDQRTVNENTYSNAAKIASVKDENTAYASIKASDELDSSVDYRWIEFMTQISMSTKRGVTKSQEYAGSIGVAQTKSTYSESWLRNMSQPKVRERIFEIIHRNNLIPEFYFIVNASDTRLKPAHQRQFTAWCKRQGIDLDALLNEYELEGIIQNPQPNSDLVADIDTSVSSNEPRSLELSNPYGYSEEEIEFIASFKSVYYESDHIGRYINYETHTALFGYNNTLTSDVLDQMESGLEDIFSRLPQQVANPDFPDGNLLGNLIYLIPMAEFSQKETKAILAQIVLRGLIAPFDDTKTDKDMRKQWGDALNAQPEKFRNQFFQLLHEHKLLVPFLAVSGREDAYVGEYATAMIMDWMRENEIDPTKTVLDHELPYPKDIEGQEVLGKLSNDDILALDNATKPAQELDDDLKNSQDENDNPEKSNYNMDTDLEIKDLGDGRIRISFPGLKPEFVPDTFTPEQIENYISRKREAFQKRQLTYPVTDPDVDVSLIDKLGQHFDEISEGGHTTINLKALVEEYELDYELASLSVDKTSGMVLVSEEGRVVSVDDHVRKARREVYGEFTSANQDAFNLYINILHDSRTIVLEKAAETSKRYISEEKARFKRVFTPRDRDQIFDVLGRMHRYGMVGMINTNFGKIAIEKDGQEMRRNASVLPDYLKKCFHQWLKIEIENTYPADHESTQLNPKNDNSTDKIADNKSELDATFKAKILELAKASHTPEVSGSFLLSGLFTLLNEQGYSDLTGQSNLSDIRKTQEDKYKDALLLTKLIFVDNSRKAIEATDGYKGTTKTQNLKAKKALTNKFFTQLSQPQLNQLFSRLEEYGLLDELKLAALSQETILKRDLAKKITRWQEANLPENVNEGITPLEIGPDSLPEVEETGAEPEKASVAEPESESYLNFSKHTDVVHSPNGRDVYEEYRKRAIQRDNDKYATLSETDINEPYDAHDNAERDIPRVYVPNLLPEGNSDHEGALELTGDFTGAGGRRGKRQVIIQEERRDLVVEALKLNPQIDSTTIREYTHPEFDTAEGLYYTVIHAETYDGNWTQVAVSTAKGDGLFVDKHRQIVDPLTGRSRLGISDLREDLLIQRIKYLEDHPESYRARIDEISTMSPDDVPESTKTSIQWEKLRKYGDKVANQIHSSYAEHIRKFGEGVACEGKETSELIIKTGDMRLDPNEEHPSLIYRTRWDRVVSAVREGKVTGLGDLAIADQGNTETARKQVEKGLLQWVVDNDPTNELFDCLRPDVQEWLCSDEDDMPQKPSEQPVNGHETSSATVTEVNEALTGKEAANDDEMIDMGDGRKYPRSLLERKLGL